MEELLCIGCDPHSDRKQRGARLYSPISFWKGAGNRRSYTANAVSVLRHYNEITDASDRWWSLLKLLHEVGDSDACGQCSGYFWILMDLLSPGLPRFVAGNDVLLWFETKKHIPAPSLSRIARWPTADGTGPRIACVLLMWSSPLLENKSAIKDLMEKIDSTCRLRRSCGGCDQRVGKSIPHQCNHPRNHRRQGYHHDLRFPGTTLTRSGPIGRWILHLRYPKSIATRWPITDSKISSMSALKRKSLLRLISLTQSKPFLGGLGRFDFIKGGKVFTSLITNWLHWTKLEWRDRAFLWQVCRRSLTHPIARKKKNSRLILGEFTIKDKTDLISSSGLADPRQWRSQSSRLGSWRRRRRYPQSYYLKTEKHIWRAEQLIARSTGVALIDRLRAKWRPRLGNPFFKDGSLKISLAVPTT